MSKGVRKTQTEEEDLMVAIILTLKEIKDCLATQTILLHEVVAWIQLKPEHEC